MFVSSSLPASVFLPTRLKGLNRKSGGHFSAVWGRLEWTDANQLPRESKVMDGENEREIYCTFRVGEGRKSGTGAKTGKVEEGEISR